MFVRLPETHEGCYSIPSGIKRICGGAFSGCSSLISIEIPDSVTAIGNGAFSGCSSLTSIEIPDSVKEIRNRAFEGCSSLTRIKMRVKDPHGINIHDNAFRGFDPSLCTLYVPIGTEYAYRHHPVFSMFKEVIIER